MSLKDRIKAADDRPFHDEDVSEWGVKLRIRGLTGTQRDHFEAELVEIRNSGRDVGARLENFRSKLLVLCLYDPETDERVFTDGEVAVVGAKSGLVVQRLFKLAQRLSGMDEAAVERAEGNSGADPSGSSTTG